MKWKEGTRRTKDKKLSGETQEQRVGAFFRARTEVRVIAFWGTQEKVEDLLYQGNLWGNLLRHFKLVSTSGAVGRSGRVRIKGGWGF